tara:strand:- start:86 stop:376 length:291 start_codon:yes stop_codon:yes gene_type:complete
MLRKKEKKAITSTIALLIGWPVGLDKFLEGKSKRGFQIFLGWLISGIVLTYGLFEYINYQEGSGFVVFGSIAVSIGTVCFFSELIANLKAFEESED